MTEAPSLKLPENGVRSAPLDDALATYLDRLAAQAPLVIDIRTGAGHIFFDLIARWPNAMGDNADPRALELCNRITGLLYPLAARELAQAIAIHMRLSATPLVAPAVPPVAATLATFDTTRRLILVCETDPAHAPAVLTDLAINSGLQIIGQPLHAGYHALKDRRARRAHPKKNVWHWTLRALNLLFDQRGPWYRTRAINPDLVHHLRAVSDVAQVLNNGNAAPSPAAEAAALYLPAAILDLEQRLRDAAATPRLAPEEKTSLDTMAKELDLLRPKIEPSASPSLPPSPPAPHAHHRYHLDPGPSPTPFPELWNRKD